MSRQFPGGKRPGSFAVRPGEADSDIEELLAYSSDSAPEENEDPIIGRLGFGERKQVRKLLRRIARGDIPGEGAAGPNGDNNEESDDWMIDDRNENIRSNRRGDVQVYCHISLATQPSRAPRKSASQWHPVRPFPRVRPTSSLRQERPRQRVLARKTSSSTRPRATPSKHSRGTNNARTLQLPTARNFTKPQYALKSAPSSRATPNMIEQNATIFVDETEEIRALMEGRGGRRSDKSTTTDDDDEWDETAGRNKPRVFRARHQARLGSRSPPADRVPERDISKEEQEDIRRAIELSLQEMNPPVPSSLPQVHPEESPLPDTERLAPPVRRTRTESDDRPDSGARNRETGEIIAVENEPMAPRQTRHSRIDNGLGSDQRDHKDNVDEDKPVGRRKTRNSENNHPRVTVQETIGDSTRDNEPFGSGKTRSGNTESASATDGQTTRRNSAVARPAAGPVTYPVTRRPSNRCDKCVRLHRACPHNRSGQEGATHGNKHTGRKIGGNDELIQPGEELETHKQYTRSKGRDPVIDTRKTDKSSGSRMSGTVAAQSTEKKRARRNNQYSGGDTTESDEMTRPSKRKKTKKTVTEGAASRGKNQKAGEIPVLYPASQPPPKVTASRTEIRTEEFQKTLREEAGQVHHTFDPAKTNPLDRHTRSVTGRTPYSTDLPPRLGRSLADRVRSPPPVEQVQVTPARPTFSASGRTVTPLERSSVGGIQYRQQPAEPQVARAEINPEGIAMPWNQIERPVTESRMRNEAAEQVEQQTPRAGTSAQETEEGRDGIADYYSRIAEEDPFARFQ